MSRVIAVTAHDTHALRRQVLRNDDPHANVDWAGDHEPDTLHLGIRAADDTIVAVSTWLTRPHPDRPTEPCRQLRGMATDPEHRSSGLGSSLLDDGVRRAAVDGFELAWANARIEAIAFYVRHGWSASGPVFETVDTGLPHRLVTLRFA